MNLIAVPGGELAAYSFGKGPPVIFLHGGPGDTHDYMKRMAEPLLDQFQCIFFDQRGTGGSSNFKRDQSVFKVDQLLNDLIAVASYFDANRPALVGHSWGAMYALFACIQFPTTFHKAALISMGPLDDEMGQGTANHLMSVLDAPEKTEWTRLRNERNAARDKGDIALVNDVDHKLMHLRVKAWVFNPKLRTEFLEEYFLDPPPDRKVNKWVWSSAETWFAWDNLKKIEAAIWICSGAADSVPLIQTERVAAGIKNSRVTVLRNCGHIPWLEHPDLFYGNIREFLTNQE